MSVAAPTTAVVAAAARHIVFRWRAPQLKRLGHILPDCFLHVVHRLLSIQKTTGHRIVNEDIAMFVELRDLVVLQRRAHLLFLLQQLTTFDH